MAGREIYRGKVIDVHIEAVTLPNGRDCELEIVAHPGGAACVAVNEQNQLCLIRQFRHVAGGFIWELPGGKIEDDEPPLETARRELREEAGVVAGRWRELGSMLSSPGVFDEVIHLYMATQLQWVGPAHEQHELIEIHWLPVDEALTLLMRTEIRDAKTIAGIVLARLAPS